MSVWGRLSHTSGLSREHRPRKTKTGTEVAHVTRDLDNTFEVKVTRPLCSLPCWGVRRLQRWPLQRVGRGKLLLGGARRLGAHGGGEGRGHIVATARLQLVIRMECERSCCGILCCQWMCSKSSAVKHVFFFAGSCMIFSIPAESRNICLSSMWNLGFPSSLALCSCLLRGWSFPSGSRTDRQTDGWTEGATDVTQYCVDLAGYEAWCWPRADCTPARPGNDELWMNRWTRKCTLWRCKSTPTPLITVIISK